MSGIRDQIDTTIEIVTPENIAFEYRLAGPYQRLGAYLIDLAVRLVTAQLSWLVVMLVFSSIDLPALGVAVVILIGIGLIWFYGPLFEIFMNGRTPGKAAMRLRVLSSDGQPINAMQAILRNFLRLIDMQPVIFYLVGLASATASPRFQRLGDLAAGTMVIVENRSWLGALVRIGDPVAIELAAHVPVGFVPSRSLVRALAAYVQRRQSFSPSRRIEIAAHLAEPLRQRFGWPPTNPDALLCALYYRVFLAHAKGEAADRAAGSAPVIATAAPVSPVPVAVVAPPRAESIRT